MNSRERQAAKSAKIASGLQATTPAAQCELGRAFLEAGQTAKAENSCREALRQQPDFAEALHLMGGIAFSRRQYDRAVEWFARAIRQSPRPGYLVCLGTALGELGRLDEALKAYDKALLFTPEDARIWTHMGRVLTEAKRYEEAALSLQHAMKLDPRLLEATARGGEALCKLKRYEEALACFDVANELQPNRPDTVYNRAYCLLRLNRLDEAFDESNRALGLNPGNPLAHNNLAIILQSRGQYADAVNCFNAALAQRPNDALIRSNLGQLQLLLGNFEEGWVGREWRWKVPSFGPGKRQFPKPLWLGDTPIDGKTILLQSDEGLGDTLHFVRYAPMVAARGARVILQVYDSIYPVLRGMSGVAECLPWSSTAVPEFDLHCSITSLPAAFKTRLETIPSAVPYLPTPSVERERFWEDRLGARDGLRVGLVWSGDPRHNDDHNRSIALSALAPLLDLEVTFVSLQKGARDQDQATLRERPDIVDPSTYLTDFAETAALVSNLDLVISVDTSVVHLAGGLGCPVWIMLPFNPDWRWLLNREDSPWYPTARLFRQTVSGDWANVIERVRTELQALIAISGTRANSSIELT
jgi:tetratricopeptide (TPR) repeat protein